MAFRKYSKRPTFKRKKKSTLARRAYRSVRQLRGMLEAEKKYHEISANYLAGGSGSNQNGTTLLLNGNAQGSTHTSRTGLSYLMKSLFYRGHIQIHPSASNTQVRIILFWDTQQVADTSAVTTNVLRDTGVSTAPLSPILLDNQGRYKIIKDIFVDLNSVSKPSYCFKNYMKLNKQIKFNGTASSDIQKNGLYMTLISSEGTALSPKVYINYRIGFYDN